jgi:hypothetical protein
MRDFADGRLHDEITKMKMLNKAFRQGFRSATYFGDGI